MDRSEVRGRGERFLVPRISGRGVRAWLGLASLFAWIQLLLCFEGLLRDTAVEKGGLVHDPFFVAATLAAGSLLILSVAIDAPLSAASLRDVRAVLPACLGAGLVGIAAVVVTALAPGAPVVVPVVLGCLAGSFIGWSTLAWGTVLGERDLREAMLVVFIAAVAQWLPLAVLSLLSLPLRIVLIAGLPMLMGHVLTHPLPASEKFDQDPAGAVGDRGSGRAACGARAVRPHASSVEAGGGKGAGPGGRAVRDRDLGARLPRMAAAMFLCSFVVQFMWCFFIKMLPGRLEPRLFAGVFLVVVAVCGATVGICARIMERQRRYRLELFWRAMLLISVAGVAATGLAGSADVSQALLFSSYAMVYAGFSIMGPTLWLLALGYAFLRGRPAQQVLGAVAGCQYVGLAFGFGMCDLLVRLVGGGAGGGPGILPAVVLGSVLVLTAACTLVFPERELLSLAPELFGLSVESIETRCSTIAARHGLTQRESELLGILARGRDVAFAAERMGIAKNTASVHRKNVYAKLGVHSQQELLSLVERERA